MKLKTIYFVLSTLLAFGALTAQQDPNFTFYRYNMNLINPAFAGSNGVTDMEWASEASGQV